MCKYCIDDKMGGIICASHAKGRNECDIGFPLRFEPFIHHKSDSYRNNRASSSPVVGCESSEKCYYELYLSFY